MKRLNKISLKTSLVVIEEGLSVMQLSNFELGRLMGGDYAGCYADTCIGNVCLCNTCDDVCDGNIACSQDFCGMYAYLPDFI